jgi:hypothetical protein
VFLVDLAFQILEAKSYTRMRSIKPKYAGLRNCLASATCPYLLSINAMCPAQCTFDKCCSQASKAKYLPEIQTWLDDLS